MDEQPGRHVVAACGETSMKVPATGLISASYSIRNSSPEFFAPVIYGYNRNREQSERQERRREHQENRFLGVYGCWEEICGKGRCRSQQLHITELRRLRQENLKQVPQAQKKEQGNGHINNMRRLDSIE